MYVLGFFANIFRNISQAKNWARYYKMYIVKYPFLLSDFNENWILSREFRKVIKYKIPWKSVQWEPSFSMQKGGHDEANSGFAKFSNAPKHMPWKWNKKQNPQQLLIPSLYPSKLNKEEGSTLSLTQRLLGSIALSNSTLTATTTQTYIHTYIHTYIQVHTYIHTYIHTFLFLQYLRPPYHRPAMIWLYTGAYKLSEDFAKPYFHKYWTEIHDVTTIWF
jgi:hypothetical protein